MTTSGRRRRQSSEPVLTWMKRVADTTRVETRNSPRPDLKVQLCESRPMVLHCRHVSMTEDEARMKTLSLKLPEELDIRIGAIARQRGSSKSEVVRSALEAYLPERRILVPDRRWISRVTWSGRWTAQATSLITKSRCADTATEVAYNPEHRAVGCPAQSTRQLPRLGARLLCRGGTAAAYL